MPFFYMSDIKLQPSLNSLDKTSSPIYSVPIKKH